jgi:hypothetical protein
MLQNTRPEAARDTSARVGRSVVGFGRWILGGLIVAVMIGGFSSTAEADPVAVTSALPVLAITATPGSTVAVHLAIATSDATVGAPLDANTFSLITPPQVGQVESSDSVVSYTAPADVPEQYVTLAPSPQVQGPTAPPVPPIVVPVFFEYTACTDLALTVCQTGEVSIVIEPSTLVSNSNPTIAVETDQTIAITPDVYLTHPAGVDWSTLQVHADQGEATVNAEAIDYTAAAQVGNDRISFDACPVGDPNSCITGSIAVSVVAPFAPDAVTDSVSFAPDRTLVVIVPGLRSANPPDETTVTVNHQPVAGNVVVRDGTFVVSGLAPDFAGPLSFSYYACSSINPADCATGSITVTVPPPAQAAPVAQSAPVAPNPGGASTSGFHAATSVGPTASAKTATAAVLPQTSRPASPAGSMDITWWVFGGALLLALGGGTGLLTTTKR